nr:hypothetical protein [Wolbachia endosymbiont of Mansonella perstans]
MENIKEKHMRLQSSIKASLSITEKNMTLPLQLEQELLVKVATVGIFLKYALNLRKD